MKIKVNLIPPYKKAEIEKNNRFVFLVKWEIEILFILVIFFTFILSLDYILKINLISSSDVLKSSLKNNVQLKEVKKYEEEFKEVNAKINEIDKIQKKQLYWSKLFKKIGEKLNDNVKLVGISNSNFAVSLTGNSNTRDDLINFKDKLSEDSCFENVNLPLSNLVSKSNIVFQMNFMVKEDCINE